MQLRRACTTGCVVLLCLIIAGHARAADAPAPAPAPDAGDWYTHPLSILGSAARSVGSAADSAWTSIGGLFGGSDPYEYLPSQVSDDDRRFIAVLDALGLQLGEIKVGGGLFSHSRYRFVAARDASDVDIQRAERMLEDYRTAASGLRTSAKQRIIRAVLDVAGDKNFVLTAVIVDMWPWPSVKYEITARNRPPEASERRVIDATQQ
jgi:hypothetical protein